MPAPDGSLSLDQLLDEARAETPRLRPAEALQAKDDGALLVDIRPDAQRRRDGEIDGAVVIDRNVLEWRLAPGAERRIPQADGRPVVVICNQGYSSSLAAHTLRRLGVAGATDVIGGFEAWVADGMPVRDMIIEP
jgi:rhodanese-related sulfurtransferase